MIEFKDSSDYYAHGYCIYEYYIAMDRELWRHKDRIYSLPSNSVETYEGKFVGIEQPLPFARLDDVRKENGDC
jgi:hypothetical protein